MQKIKLISTIYFLVIFSLFLYSFTQIDLGLTLTQWSIWQVAQKFFQNIGYFSRPLSTFLYSSIIILLFIFYGIFLWLATKEKISKKQIWIIILISSFILTFSYNAFSYDLFNYIFDAKIVTFYHQNPYFHKALDYPGDPMLSFMHWTHRVYPYGPAWLGLTVPLSFLGLQFFLPNFFLFKIFVSLSFIGTVFYLGKIMKEISPKDEVFSLVFFGLNPLVIIESLVSSHNDITMMFFLLCSLYLFLNKKYFRSFLLFIISIGVKFASILLIPVFVLIFFLYQRKKEIPWKTVWLIATALMIIGVIFASNRTNFQPWYLLYVLPLAAIIGKKYYVLIPSLVLSFFALLQYLPFLYLGNWDKPIPTILYWLMAISIVLSLLVTACWLFLIKLNWSFGQKIKK